MDTKGLNLIILILPDFRLATRYFFSFKYFFVLKFEIYSYNSSNDITDLDYQVSYDPKPSQVPYSIHPIPYKRHPPPPPPQLLPNIYQS